MMPTVEEICIKDIISIDINKTISDAIKLMSESNIRNILITANNDDEQFYYMLTTNELIELKLQEISVSSKLSTLDLRKIRRVDAKISIVEILNQITVDNDYMVVMSSNKLIGIVSQTDIVNSIDPEILMQRQTIGKLMLQYTAVTIYEDEATVNAITLMNKQDIDSVIIIDQNNAPAGIFTTKDFLNLIHLDCDLSQSVKKFMSSPLQTIRYDATISTALEFIRKRRFKRLVVVDDKDQLMGVVTQVELLRLVNNKWMEIVKEEGGKLSKINEELIEKTAQLEEKASTDFLTKLYNRSKFDAMITYEIHQVQRYKERNLSLLLIDIDDFKYINDTYGHPVGDNILQEIAHILQISSRQSDVAARWGGEEFVLSLPETNIEQAILVAEKIRSTVENHKFTQGLRITCSVGVAQFHTTDNYVDLFKRVDEALYKAKNSGKNKVEMESL